MEKPRLRPFVKGYPLIGSFFGMLRDPFDFLTRAARDYGDVLRVRVGPFNETCNAQAPDDRKRLKMQALELRV